MIRILTDMLKFITGNKNKFKEAQEVLAPIKIEQLDIDLAEIQDIDSKKVIEYKLIEAFKHHNGPFIIDDSSLFLEYFDYKLPGPFVKWFNEVIGMKGYFDLCSKVKKYKAKAQTQLAYAESPKKVVFFEGSLNGKIVKPKGNYGFGYDQIFLQHGQIYTLAEQKANKIFIKSPRGIAILKLKKYLNGKNK